MSETIAAISTPLGQGGIGIVRISGDSALDIMKKIFVECPENPEPRHVYFGHAADPDEVSVHNGKDPQIIDEAVFIYMKGPHSYTCEDVVEIQAHGGPVSMNMILKASLKAGARMAEPGEFTKLAFLNGRLDLSQAEAVMDIISSRTEIPHMVAAGQLQGSVGRRVRSIRSSILDVLAQMAVNIDFPDEDIEESEYSALADAVLHEKKEIRSLLDSAPSGRIIREGVRVAIIGSPNAGKSSLMNGLLGSNRAIVTDVPGTTRDTIEETVDIGGLPVVIIDTAGIRDTNDQVEKIGIDRSIDAVKMADMVLFVVDGSRKPEEEDLSIAELVRESGKNDKTIVILNKKDKGFVSDGEEISSAAGADTVLETSLVPGDDLDASIQLISDKMKEMIFSNTSLTGDQVFITNQRQKDALERAYDGLDQSEILIRSGEALEVCELEVRRGYDALGEVIGEETGDQILDAVFSRFCLGK